MKNTLKLLCISLFLLTALQPGCREEELPVTLPECVQSKIRYGVREKGVLPIEVWKWAYNGNTWYYFQMECCDQLNYLYNEDCTYLCAPDGGISGAGGGDCFLQDSLITKTLVWMEKK
jgi:hypothetical protein